MVSPVTTSPGYTNTPEAGDSSQWKCSGAVSVGCHQPPLLLPLELEPVELAEEVAAAELLLDAALVELPAVEPPWLRVELALDVLLAVDPLEEPPLLEVAAAVEERELAPVVPPSVPVVVPPEQAKSRTLVQGKMRRRRRFGM
jgi:hypothetical protein